MKRNHVFILIFIVAAGIILRFYRLPEYVIFLGDQGRDAIIIKRILTLEHFPAIGPTTSVGQVYLGPFYYYFIAPWLLLFWFNPLGLAFGVAFFSSLSVLITYFVVKELFNENVALLSSFFTAFSSTLVEYSRFSWNPNLLPVFTLLTVYFFVKAFESKKWQYYIVSGAFLSFSIQLHYLALILLPPVAFLFILRFFEERKLKETVKEVGITAGSFLFFSLPLVIFDLRHDFLNSRNFITFFKESSPVATNKLLSFLDSFSILNQYTFLTPINKILSGVVLLCVFFLFITSFSKKNALRIFLVFFIFLLLGISLYGGPKYPHYFQTLYPIYFVVISYLLSFLLTVSLGSLFIIIFLLSFLFLNSRGYDFLFKRHTNQINRAANVAKIIFDHVSQKKFTLTALPNQYSDTSFRYFLEIWRKKPIEKESLEKGIELFIVCEEKCNPMDSPQWDIAYFAARKVVGVWKTYDVTIYKLTR